MAAVSKYKVLDELRYLMRQQTSEERATLAAQIVRDGLREPLAVWDRKPDLVVLDGHNRLEICAEHDVPIRHKVIQGINSLAQAEEWMIQNQLGRRNITPNEKAYFIGLRYDRAKGQGKRTDLSADGKSLDTAQLFAEEYNVSDRAIRDMARFYHAVLVLDGTVQAKSRILHESLPLSRDEIIQIADQPEKNTATCGRSHSPRVRTCRTCSRNVASRARVRAASHNLVPRRTPPPSSTTSRT
jgi:hypothetical protein